MVALDNVVNKFIVDGFTSIAFKVNNDRCKIYNTKLQRC